MGFVTNLIALVLVTAPAAFADGAQSTVATQPTAMATAAQPAAPTAPAQPAAYTGWVDAAGKPATAATARGWYDAGKPARSREVYVPATGAWYWVDADGSIARGMRLIPAGGVR